MNELTLSDIEIKTLRLSPDDIVVINLNTTLAREEVFSSLRTMKDSYFPDNPVLVLQPDIRIGISDKDTVKEWLHYMKELVGEIWEEV